MRKTVQTTAMAGLIAGAPLMFCAGAAAGEFLYEFWEPYRQRVEGVTAGAGNAKAVNAATHIIDPWPRYVGNRRIPANGERMVGAIERYRDVRKLPLTPPPLAPTAIGLTGPSGTSTTTAPPTTTPTAR